MTNDPNDPSEPVESTSIDWMQRLNEIQQERNQLQQERLDRKLAEHTATVTQALAHIQPFLWVQALLLSATFGLVLSLVVTNRSTPNLPAQTAPQSRPTHPEN